MTSAKKVLLYSGGLDSFCLHKLNPDIDHLVYFHLGMPENDMELEHMLSHNPSEKLIIDHRFQDSLRDQKLDNEVLPFRNIFMALGALYYGAKIYLGATATSTNYDKTSMFKKYFEDLVKYVSQDPTKNPEGLLAEDIELIMPFQNVTKTRFVKSVKVLYENDLTKTRSCYKGGMKECGKCVSCVRKYIAFVNNYISVDFDEDPGTLLEDELVKAEQYSNPQIKEEIENAIFLHDEGLVRYV